MSTQPGRPAPPETAGGDASVAALIVIASALVLAALPIFLVGGLAVQIRAELGLSESAFGAAVTFGFAIGAVAALLGGRIADRLGARTVVYVGAAMSSIALVIIGATVRSWGGLVAALCVSGLAVALTDPGLAILVGRSVPPARHGLAFGIKEASIPTATLAAGLAVPWIALTVGWRWAFAIGVIPASILVLLLPRVIRSSHPKEGDHTSQPRVGLPAKNRTPMLLAGIAGFLGSGAASGVGVFLTESAVAMGFSPAAAGLLLAAGSAAGIIVRIGSGIAADRIGGAQFRLISIMLAVGAITIALGATGVTPLLIAGAVGAFTGGWAWTGIFFLSLIKTNPSRPGAVAGIGTASLGLGNAAGPIFFGVMAETASFSVAWLSAGVAAALGAILMAGAHRRFAA